MTWPGTVLGPWEGGGDARGGGPGNQQQQAGRYHGRPRDSSTAQRGRGVGRGGRPWRSQGPPGAQPPHQQPGFSAVSDPALATDQRSIGVHTAPFLTVVFIILSFILVAQYTNVGINLRERRQFMMSLLWRDQRRPFFETPGFQHHVLTVFYIIFCAM